VDELADLPPDALRLIRKALRAAFQRGRQSAETRFDKLLQRHTQVKGLNGTTGLFKGEWEEQKHPRDHGKFSSKPGDAGGGREVVGRGNTGEVYRDGDEVVKQTVKPDGTRSREGEHYETLRGVVGLAPGRQDGDTVRLPHYQEVLSVDTVPDEQARLSMGTEVGKNKARLLNVANALAEASLDYNDPLQVGFDDDYNAHVIDLSNAGRVESQRTALRANIDRVVRFLSDFGAQHTADAIQRTYSVLNQSQLLLPKDAERRMTALAKNGNRTAQHIVSMGAEKVANYGAKHAYYATNPRPVGRDVLQSEPDANGVKVILSKEPLDADTIRQYSLTPVVHPADRTEVGKAFTIQKRKDASGHEHADDGKFTGGGKQAGNTPLTREGNAGQGVAAGGHADNAARAQHSSPDPIPDEHLLDGLHAEVPPGLWEQSVGKVKRAARAVHEKLVLATPAFLKLQGLFERLENLDDLRTLGYQPVLSGVAGHGTPDALREATGVGGTLGARLAAHVLARVVSWMRKGLTADEAVGKALEEAGDPLAECGALIADALKLLAEEFGLGDTPDAAAVADALGAMRGDQLEGGEADDLPDSAVPADALAEGAAHEREHTSDPAVAREIAKDHLASGGADYYEKLKRVEGDDGGDPHASAAIAMLDHAIACAESGEDVQAGLDRIADALEEPEDFHAAVGKAWDSSKHPRSDDGKFISKDAIHDAKSDPAKADALRARVTDPAQRAKLDAALGGESDLGRTKKREAKDAAAERRKTRQASKDKAKEVLRRVSSRGDVSADDVRDLADHLPALTVAELRLHREALMAKLGGKRVKEQYVRALVEHAKGRAAGEATPETPPATGLDAPPAPGRVVLRVNGKGRAATAHDLGSGVRLLAPDDLDRARQHLAPDDVRAAAAQVPEQYRPLIREVHLRDEYSDDGNEKAFGSHDPAGGGVVELHRNDRHTPEAARRQAGATLRHEAAHALAEKLGPGFVRDWRAAAKEDGGHITPYAATDTHEDIAETVMHHWSPDATERRAVATFFPARARVLAKYGVAPGGTPPTPAPATDLDGARVARDTAAPTPGGSAMTNQAEQPKPAKQPRAAKPTTTTPMTARSVADALGDLKRRHARKGGIVTVPELIDELKARHAGVTTEDVHRQLLAMKDADHVTLQVSNDPHLDPRRGEYIQSPKGQYGYVAPGQVEPPAETAPAPTPAPPSLKPRLGRPGGGDRSNEGSAFAERQAAAKQQPAAPPARKPPKAAAPAESAAKLRAAIERDKADPGPHAHAAADKLLAELRAAHSDDELKALAKEVTGKHGGSAASALRYLRADLTAVTRALESQDV
jgi:hypothetical protein